MNKLRGFTLVELLVVIAIIGGLSSLLVPNFMAARERTRDAKRISDLHQIQKALELYKQDQSPPSYPATDTFIRAVDDCWTSDGSGGSCTGNLYMSHMPKEPIGQPQTFYYYERDTGDTLKYTLCACAENTADENAISDDCNTTTYGCSSGKVYRINEP